MRLTNSQREGILEQEITLKFNEVENENERKLIEACKKQIEKNIPKELLDIQVKYPQYLNTTCSVEFSDKHLACEAGKRYFDLQDYYPVEEWARLEVEVKGEIKKILEKMVKIKKEKQQLKIDLKAILFSVTTVKKLLEIVPEFKDYFPENKTETAIVPASLIKNVRKNLVRGAK